MDNHPRAVSVSDGHFFRSLITGLLVFFGGFGRSAADSNLVTAIDIVLTPNDTLTRTAEAVNARLFQAFPDGFVFDASHHPHISLLQRYVRTGSLGHVNEAVDRILRGAKIGGLKLTATGYFLPPGDSVGLIGIVIAPTPELRDLQQKLIDAVAPFTVEGGMAAAFFAMSDEPVIDQKTIDYVAAFVPEAAGGKFSPHITVGLGTGPFLEKAFAAPFCVFYDVAFGGGDLSTRPIGDGAERDQDVETGAVTVCEGPRFVSLGEFVTGGNRINDLKLPQAVALVSCTVERYIGPQ